MKRLAALFLFTAFGLGAAASAQPKPAWMLIYAHNGGNFLTREFPSMEECEAVADHISKVRTPNSSTEGIKGTWKFNYTKKHEPRVVTLCVPDSSEIKGVKSILKEKNLYRMM